MPTSHAPLTARLKRRIARARSTPNASGATPGEQILLREQYRLAGRLGAPAPRLSNTEFRNYSQNGEDGILLYLTTVLGLDEGLMVEIGCGDGIECNSANLLINHGWDGLLIDADTASMARGTAFYADRPETRRVPPTFIEAWVGSGTIKSLLREHCAARQVDVLSIDLDSIDYWVAEALADLPSSIVVVEYNNRIPATAAVTVPDGDRFVAANVDPDYTHGEGYFGASLAAFVQALQHHRLVGANRVNTNAFFVQRGLGEDILPEVTAEACLSSPWARLQQDRWWEILQRREWVSV